ncbi:hypothetical protein P3S67_020582 [Capsicum chacoense]
MGTCLKLASFFMLWSVHRGVNGKAQALHKGISCRISEAKHEENHIILLRLIGPIFWIPSDPGKLVCS